MQSEKNYKECIIGKYRKDLRSMDIKNTLEILWKKILEVTEVNREDDFFEKGGESIKAIQLVEEINNIFGCDFKVRNIFEKSKFVEIETTILEKINTDENKAVLTTKMQASAAQRWIYQLEKFEDTKEIYNNTYAFLCDGNLNVDKLKNAFDEIIKKNVELKTTFRIEENRIMQCLDSNMEKSFEYFESSCKSEKVLIEEFNPKFDLENGPLLRAEIIKMSQDKFLFLISLHHIIFDVTSIKNFFKMLSGLYNDEAIEEQNIRYFEYTDWMNTIHKTQKYKETEQYWINRLENFHVLELPYNLAENKFEGKREIILVESKTIGKLTKYCKRNRITKFMFWIALFNVVLSEISNQRDISIATPIIGRVKKKFENIMGMFENIIIIRNIIDKNETVNSILSKTRNSVLEAFDNSEYQFGDLVLALRRQESIELDLNVMIAFDEHEDSYLELNGINISKINVPIKRSKFDLVILIDECEKNIVKFKIEYNTGCVDTKIIKELPFFIKNVFDSFINSGDEKITNILLPQKKKNASNYLCGKNIDYSINSVKEAFEKTAARFSKNTAVVCNGKKYTYTEVNEKANFLSRLIRQKVNCQEVIAVLCNTSIETIISILAVVKSGCIYLPIDEECTEHILDFFLKDSGSMLLIGSKKVVKCDRNIDTIAFEYSELGNQEENTIITPDVERKHECCMIYTSDATGVQRGIRISNIGLINLVIGLEEVVITDRDAVLQIGSFCFGTSVFQEWFALLHGAALHIESKSILLDPFLMEKYMEKNNITTMLIPTVLFNQLAVINPNIFKNIHNLFIRGDIISNKALDKVIKFSGINIFNTYGPTENAVISTIFKIDTFDKVQEIPIGKPIPNTFCLVLNDDLSIASDGQKGELYVGGIGLADGYVNQDELTKVSFIENPYFLGQMLYKTGKLVMKRKDGNLVLKGKIDK